MKKNLRFMFIPIRGTQTYLRIISCLGMFLGLISCGSPDYSQRIFIGTYTGKGGEGVYTCRFNPETGKITSPDLAIATKNPSFIAIHPKGGFLYAVNEVGKFNREQTGAVSTFSIERGTGKLSFLSQVSSMGANPAHLSLDNNGKFLLVANYSGGNFAIFPIDCDGLPEKPSSFIQNKGSGPNTGRQEGPHAHYISVSKDNRFVMVADLGIDKVVVYPFDEDKGTLDTANPVFIQLSPGSGPRHFTFNTTSNFLYVLNELTSNIAVFHFDTATAATQPIQTITTLPAGFTGENTCAEILTSADGRFIYASNRGHNSIVQFAINTETGSLTPVDWFPTGGQTPRHFAIDPTGRWLFAANQNSGNITLFRIDPETGRLVATNKEIKVKTPVCVTFMEGK